MAILEFVAKLGLNGTLLAQLGPFQAQNGLARTRSFRTPISEWYRFLDNFVLSFSLLFTANRIQCDKPDPDLTLSLFRFEMCFFPSPRTCKANEALAVTGWSHKKKEGTMVTGGTVWVWDCMGNKVRRLSLNTFTLQILSLNVETIQGVKITCSGVVQVKVESRNKKVLAQAFINLGGKSTEEITYLAQSTMEGHQRGIIGTMTVEEIFRERKEFAKRVFEVASTDMLNMGFNVVSYNVKDIKDSNGYLKGTH